MKLPRDGMKRLGSPLAASFATISGMRASSRVCSTASCSPLRSSGIPVTAKTCMSAPAACCSASSTRPCGTISPPIFEKRESRSVIVKNPSSSKVAMSPVMYQPSRRTLAVRSSRPRYPVITLGPLTSSMPGVSGGNGVKLSGSTICTDTPGSGWPTVPRREAGW